MMRAARRASLLVAFCVLAGCASSAPFKQTEPIPLDSKDPRYNDYLNRVRLMIREKWTYPCVKNEATGRCEYKSTLVVIEFGILKDGSVPFVMVRKQSDFDIYDKYAVNAIKLASPFPPVPRSLTGGRKGIPILATFSYLVEGELP